MTTNSTDRAAAPIGELLATFGLAPGEATLVDATRLDAAALDAALDDVYRSLPVGARVVIHERVLSGRRAAAAVPGPVDRITTALYRAGFVEPRLRTRAGSIAATARRGEALPPARRTPKLSVVLPVYNEVSTFAEVIGELRHKELDGVDIEVIVVESGSTDGTRELVDELTEESRFRVVLESRPRGKGHAVRAGIAAATGDFVLIQDADLEYELADYARLLEPLLQGRASFVLGNRTKTSGARWGVRHFEREVLVSKLLNVGNFLFLRLFNIVYRQHLKDPFTMYKVFRRDCVAALRLECNRFDFDWELTAKLVRRGYRPLEIPVTYHSRGFSDGKKVSVLRDPWTWVVACIRYRLQRVNDWEIA